MDYVIDHNQRCTYRLVGEHADMIVAKVDPRQSFLEESFIDIEALQYIRTASNADLADLVDFPLTRLCEGEVA